MSAQLVRNISSIRYKIAQLNPTTNDFKLARDGNFDQNLSMHKLAYLGYLRSLIIQIREIRTELKRVKEKRAPGHFLMRYARLRVRMMETCFDTSPKGVRTIRHKLVELDTIEYTVHSGPVGKGKALPFRLPPDWIPFNMLTDGLVVTVPKVLFGNDFGAVASMEYITFTGKSIKKGFVVIMNQHVEKGFPVTADKVDSLEEGKRVLESKIIDRFKKLANLC